MPDQEFEHVDVYRSAPVEPLSVDEITDTAGPVHGTPVVASRSQATAGIPSDQVPGHGGVQLSELDPGHADLRAALQAVWDECNEYIVFEPVRDQVKKALGLREFEAGAAHEPP
jgi:hypothetical protein